MMYLNSIFIINKKKTAMEQVELKKADLEPDKKTIISKKTANNKYHPFFSFIQKNNESINEKENMTPASLESILSLGSLPATMIALKLK